MRVSDSHRKQVISFAAAFGASSLLPEDASSKAKLVTRIAGATLTYQAMQPGQESLRTIFSMATGALISSAFGLDPHAGGVIALGAYALLTPTEEGKTGNIWEKIIFGSQPQIK